MIRTIIFLQCEEFALLSFITFCGSSIGPTSATKSNVYNANNDNDNIIINTLLEIIIRFNSSIDCNNGYTNRLHRWEFMEDVNLLLIISILTTKIFVSGKPWHYTDQDV